VFYEVLQAGDLQHASPATAVPKTNATAGPKILH